MVEVFQISALQDNYIYILRNSSEEVAVVDPSESQPVHQFLKEKNWPLHFILNTHHHFDHVGGNLELKKMWNSSVIGFHKDAHRIPGIDISLKEDEIWSWGGEKCQILFIPGHTLGHIAFWFIDEKLLFCGDTLFGMGCGRLFEGTAEQMLSSLQKLSSLPQDTLVYCGHEYTYKNGLFALKVEGGNPYIKERCETIAKNQKKPTVPFYLRDELRTNPFLRCAHFMKEDLITHPDLKKHWKSKLEIFTQIRKLKDHF